MNSPITGKPMVLKTEVKPITFRKEEFTVPYRFYYCEDSGEGFTDPTLEDLNTSLVYNAYRAKHHIPTADEIRKTRERYDLSALRMGEILGFGQNSFGQYERGEIPSISNSKLLKLAAEPESFRQLVMDWETDDLKAKDQLLAKVEKIISKQSGYGLFFENYLMGESKMSEFSGFRKPSFEILTEMVVFFSHTLPSFKTKMNKLLFYADFLAFREFGHSISGATYKAIPYGPVPEKYESIFENLSTTDVIDIHYEPKPDGSKIEKLVGREDRPVNSAKFSEKELEILQKVAEKFRGVNSSGIVDISHQETAWTENIEGKRLISYFYAFDLKAV